MRLISPRVGCSSQRKPPPAAGEEAGAATWPGPPRPRGRSTKSFRMTTRARRRKRRRTATPRRPRSLMTTRRRRWKRTTMTDYTEELEDNHKDASYSTESSFRSHRTYSSIPGDTKFRGEQGPNIRLWQDSELAFDLLQNDHQSTPDDHQSKCQRIGK
ncbi:PREDICTED: nucleosome-remodeling factor subunit BPTF-like isoform X1 [Rhinopithecus bieti]|uniref:nucleosome-remodeling factor subunit BPTF-like isoform X1 n=1 Tax=Rhinopithecus bieti TaxID=61621 RepID=UPI00083C7DCA|nr:PREDICTED: nucleosome-remodeling factor subunit BPTF-like isoform X1 [Rhinopithecus bieti]